MSGKWGGGIEGNGFVEGGKGSHWKKWKWGGK